MRVCCRLGSIILALCICLGTLPSTLAAGTYWDEDPYTLEYSYKTKRDGDEMVEDDTGFGPITRRIPRYLAGGTVTLTPNSKFAGEIETVTIYTLNTKEEYLLVSRENGNSAPMPEITLDFFDDLSIGNTAFRLSDPKGCYRISYVASMSGDELHGSNYIMIVKPEDAKTSKVSIQPLTWSALSDTTPILMLPPDIRSDPFTPFYDGLATMSYGGNKTKGYIDVMGNVILLSEYDMVSRFSEGLAAAKKNGKWGYIDKHWEWVIAPIYESAEEFSDGLAQVDRDGTKLYINKKGETVISLPPTYTVTENFSNGMARVFDPTLKGPIHSLTNLFIDKSGNTIAPNISNLEQAAQMDLSDFSEGLSAVQVITMDAKHHVYYVDQTGNIVISSDEWYGADQFTEGLAAVYKFDGRHQYGYINKTGQYAISPKYENAKPFSEGLAAVCLNGKTGYIDKTGTLVIPAEFDVLPGYCDSFFSEGLAFVYKDGKYGYIDKSGNMVISLEDFVGCTDIVASEFSGGVAKLRIFYDDGTERGAIIRSPLVNTVISSSNRSKVLVNGEQVEFDAYTIGGNNYFKLRDLAKVLSGTDKQFEVTWDGAHNAINLVSNRPYTVVGGELTQGDGANKAAQRSTSTIYLDGEPVDLTAYTIDGNNYFKLRDVGQTFDFDVSWDGANNTILIDTAHSYTADR